MPMRFLDAIAARRLLVLTPGFQTSPGYEAGQQTLTYNGAAASPSNPNGVNTGLSYYLPPARLRARAPRNM